MRFYFNDHFEESHFHFTSSILTLRRYIIGTIAKRLSRFTTKQSHGTICPSHGLRLALIREKLAFISLTATQKGCSFFLLLLFLG